MSRSRPWLAGESEAGTALGAPDGASARRELGKRLVLSLLLVWHLTAMVASLLQGSPPGDALRGLTRPYEHLFGVYQAWNMFAPNAPRSTEWMEIIGEDGQGGQRALASIAGEPGDGVKLFYSRRSKFERQLIGDGRHRVRDGVAQWACRREAAAGAPLVRVALWRVSRRTPPPDQRVAAPVGEARRTLLEEHRCR